MPNVRSNFQRTMFPGIEEFIMDGFIRQKMPQYTLVFNIKSTTDAFREDLIGAGVGLPIRTGETEEAIEDQFQVGPSKRYDWDKYTLMIGMSDEFIDDGKVNLWAERGPDMGFSFRQLLEILHADVFDSGTTVNGFDGVPLFSAAHPNVRQGTQSNLVTPAGTPSVVTMRLQLTKGRLYFDDTGVRRLDVMWEWCWHPPNYEYDVKEILKSSERPDTANRATNVIHEAVKPLTWDYLQNTKNWGLLAGKADHKLKSFDRKKFGVVPIADEKAGVQWVKGQLRNGRGYSHWRGVQVMAPT